MYAKTIPNRDSPSVTLLRELHSQDDKVRSNEPILKGNDLMHFPLP